MKALSFRQPWASSVAAGLKTIENRSWVIGYQGKILIHASSAKVPKDYIDRFSESFSDIYYNAFTFGWIPLFEEMPVSAIIGYFEVDSITPEGKELEKPDYFDDGPDCIRHHLKNAHVFDKPIMGINGKLNLWDFPDISEDNLPPSHKVDLRLPRIEGSELVFPTTERILDILLVQKEALIRFTENVIAAICKDPVSCEVPECETIRFEMDNGTRRRFGIKSAEIRFNEDENGHHLTEVLASCKIVPWRYFSIFLGKDL